MHKQLLTSKVSTYLKGARGIGLLRSRGNGDEGGAAAVVEGYGGQVLVAAAAGLGA